MILGTGAKCEYIAWQPRGGNTPSSSSAGVLIILWSWRSTSARGIYDYLPLRIDPERLSRERYHTKTIAYDARRQSSTSSKIVSLNAAKAAAGKPLAEADDDEENESEVVLATERAFEEGRRQRMALSESFVKLFAEFWSAEPSECNRRQSLTNLYNAARSTMYKPHSSVECDAGSRLRTGLTLSPATAFRWLALIS